MTELKVAFINDQPQTSGTGAYAHNLFTKLQRIGEIDHLFLNFKEKTLENRNENIFKIIDKTWFLPLIDSKPLFWKRIINKIPPYDVCHFTSQNMSFLLRQGKFSPAVITCLDIIPRIMPNSFWEYYARRYLYSGLNCAQRIIAISEHTKKDLIKYFSIPEEKIIVVYLGANENFKLRDKHWAREKLNLPLNKKIILNVSARYRRKNVKTVIKIFHRIQKEIPDTILLRVGSERRENIKLVESLGISDKVIFAQNVSSKDFPFCYNASDVLLFPSLYEGFGLPPLEAMASGCPVIASNTTSLPEVVGDGGILLDPMDIEGLKSATVRVLIDKEIKEELIAKGLKRASKFSWEKTAEETYRVYEKAVV
ncbi:MAG: glycosyltransferase family 1 protein [Candidatus Edwardsbacteria bacterium]